MKKNYILIIIFIVFIILISIIGSIMVTGNELVMVNKDILEIQNNKEVYFSSYGYSIDNPNVIVNPYDNSPLTALIMFDTNSYSDVSVCIKSKDGNSDINYTFGKDKHHFIPIYGLYANYNNIIIIRSAGKEKIINIKTKKLPKDFKYVEEGNGGNFSFYNGNYPYAVDNTGEVRWYLNSNYYGNITVLDNSRILIGSDRYTESGNTISFYEMDLLGKIYNEYLISDSYYGYNTIYNDNILILSDKILLIDKQTGKVISTYGDNNNYDYIGTDGNNIIVHDTDGYYEINDNKISKYKSDVKLSNYNFYNNTVNYMIVPSIIHGSLDVTKKSSKNISLINYKSKKIDSVSIEMDNERIKVKNYNDDKIYIILDKFMDKRIYEVGNIKYINNVKLKGKYTIYYSINDKVYKTDKYIEVK